MCVLYIDDFFNYSEYINKLLRVEYVNRAKEELKIIETRFKDFSDASDGVVKQILNIDRYIVSAEKGANVLLIKRPTLPEKISPKTSLILALSIMLGGMIGVIYVFISNAFSKYKYKDKIV